MADISVIKLPNGNSYNLKDTTARSVANSAVPNTRTVNGKALSSDISLGAGDVGAYTKSETDTKINAAVASTYKYKGSVTADKLPTSGQVVGDVYNITNDSSYGKAGMNVAWNGTTWDALGSNVDLSNYVTTSDSRLSNARPASDVYAWAKAAKKPSYSASEIGAAPASHTHTKDQVGLGNVANLDQSKAIKSITRSGTTFTATALDGTTTTFTQQDNNNFKNYILVGDSYSVGYAPEGNVTSWATLLNNLLGGHLYATIEQSGAGLSNKMTGEYNLTTRISSLTASDAVDSIICCCGRNDIDGDNISGIAQGIKDFVNACHTKFKNAKVYIGFIGWDLNKTEWTENKSIRLCQAIAEYKKVEIDADYTYINTDFIMRQRSYMASDGKHPNQDGQNALAYGIKSALYGGIPSFSKPFVQHTYPDANGGGTYQIKENFVGGTTFLQFTVDNSIYYHGTNEYVTFNNYELTVIKNVELDYIVPSGYKLTTMQAKILLQTTDGTYYTLDVPAYFKSNSDGTYDLVINITTVNHAGNNWARGTINYFIFYSSICVGNPLT